MVLQAELLQADSLTTIRDPALQRTTLIMDNKVFQLRAGRKNRDHKIKKDSKWAAYKLNRKKGTNTNVRSIPDIIL